MKIEQIQEQEQFKPIKIRFTIESEQELESFFSMVNKNKTIPDLFPQVETKDIIKEFLLKLDIALKTK